MSKIIPSTKRSNARSKIKYALKTGKIKRLPCEYSVCTNPKTEAHHPDYNFPLDVIWLCRQHHMELHSYEKSWGTWAFARVQQ